MEEQIRKWLDNDYNLRNKYLKDYDQAPDKTKWWISHRGDLRNYTGYKTLNSKISTQPLKDRLVKSLDEEDWSTAPISYKRDVAKELGTTVEKLEDAWKEHLEDVRKSNEIQARKDEVKNWPFWKKMITSDYAKERYIKDPEASLFNGDNTLRFGMTKWGEKPKLGDILEGSVLNKGEDVSDLLYGGAGLVADMIPVGNPASKIPTVGQQGLSIGLGPVVRTMRDLQHKGALPFTEESKYQKEGNEIASDALADLALNAGVHAFQNFRRGKRGAGNLIGEESDIEKTINLERRAEANQAAQYQFTQSNLMSLESNQKELSKEISKLPDSDFKKDLMRIADSPDYKPEDLRNYIKEWDDFKQGHKTIFNDVDNLTNKQSNISDTKLGQNGYDFYKSLEKAEQLEGVDKAIKPVAKGFQDIMANDNITNALMKGGADAGVSVAGIRPRSIHKPKEQEQNKFDRWEKGYATWDEKKSPEYKQWEEAHLKTILGLE